MTTTAAQQNRRQTWASATWAQGQNMISAMLYHSKGQHEFAHLHYQQNGQQYSSFRDDILMPPAYDTIVAPRPAPAPAEAPAPAPSPPTTKAAAAAATAPSPAPPPPAVAPPRHQQALELPPLPRLLGVENLDEWDDVLRRTLRLHGLAEYITAPYPGVPEPAPTHTYNNNNNNNSWPASKFLIGGGNTNNSSTTTTNNNHKNHHHLTREQWESNRAVVCLLMVGSFSADVRDTLLAHGYDPSEENPKAIHDLVLEALPKAAGEDVGAWLRELGAVSPAEPRFRGSLREYCLRLQYLRRRLNQAEPQPNDNLVMVLSVLGLGRCERYEGTSMALGRELERGNLSWLRLMGDLAALHGREVRERKKTARPWKAVDDRPGPS